MGAVVQHYNIWPTPALDLTSSLRVAASFALGLEPASATERAPALKRGSAFLYVFGFDRIISDVMKLKATSLNETELAGEELNVIRLSALRPPTTVRPHLQEGFGFLVTFPLPTANLLPAAAANTRPIAVVELVEPRMHSGRQTFPSIPKYSSAMRSQPRSLAASRINSRRSGCRWATSCRSGRPRLEAGEGGFCST